MNKVLTFLILLNLVFIPVMRMNGTPLATGQEKVAITDGEYVAVIEGYDWGPAVSKVILSAGEPISSVTKGDYTVLVAKSSDCGEISAEAAKGARTIVHAYVSDGQGNLVEQGNHVTLVLGVAPNLPLGSPMQYYRSETCRGNRWVNYKITITNTSSGDVWDKEVSQIKPLVSTFNLTGSFTQGDITMKYAWFEPASKKSKAPLLIWLHGGGEGGTDPSIPLLGNLAANYASEEIQAYFEGAYVLVPQCPGAWMHNKEGVMNEGKGEDIYNVALLALIKDYVSSNPSIDAGRIYVGGCSNGGYMSLKLILKDPGYFAAGFISSLAYQSQYISDAEIESIKHVPIWFVHSADDGTTKPEMTVLPVYKRLLGAGAKNVHLSYYENVVDITGFYGGDNYHYPGHWSWVYLHANKCRVDYDGTPVRLDGRPVTIMEWLAAQHK